MSRKKIVKVGDKTYIVDLDSEKKELEEVIEPDEIEEEEEDEKEKVEDKIEKATNEVVAKLGLEDLKKQVSDIAEKVAEKDVNKDKKISALLDLETLMKKDVSQMTANEKIIGFFQAILQSNHAVLKALSEGTASAGGYLFPDEFRAEVIRDIAEGTYMRSEVTVIPMKRDIMKIPTLDSRPKITWTEENTTKSTTTAHFNEATLTVKKMAAINLQSGIKSKDLIKNWVNCWKLSDLRQSAAKILSKGQETVQRLEFEPAYCRI